MKLPRSSAIIFTLLLILILSIERVFSLPIAMTMVFLMQQPVLNEEESCVIGGVIGLLLAVVYNLPLAVGIGLFLLVTLVSRLTLSKPHLQTRDGLLTLVFCICLATLTHLIPTTMSVVGLVVYFVLVNIFVRMWISRRSFHARPSMK